ncbi:hypothetical protein [Motilibacter aurantiacus]|uniref:hypothetical protein n=1 Tax=Motilibacter aurantiacus TaxID=2714955 RepID=UPI00140A59A6|nr:hypothetical protein [Motilibacter aurantiacus]NHC47644.1 hypothetical protein [Motilibacter aurantiacus]
MPRRERTSLEGLLTVATLEQAEMDAHVQPWRTHLFDDPATAAGLPAQALSADMVEIWGRLMLDRFRDEGTLAGAEERAEMAFLLGWPCRAAGRAPAARQGQCGALD